LIQPRSDGDLMAEISRQPHDAYARAVIGNLAQQDCRSILAAVIDVEDFEIRARAVQHFNEPVVSMRQHGLFVVAGHDDAEFTTS
jgi:hypothetical protein